MRSSQRAALTFAALLLLCAGILFDGAVFVAQKAAPASETDARFAPAEKLRMPGLPNLGRVHENLYRGGQPDAAAGGYRSLRELGIEIVVNFRNDADDVEPERAWLEALGIRLVHIPWSGFQKPDNRQVAEFLQLLQQHRNRKIFVHCQRGAERTGVMLAAYRIAVQGWTAEQALAEMEAFKFRGFWFRHLKHYVKNFPRHWASDPAFRVLQTVAAGSHP
ncbi:MAG: dual specificity protein phosphatase family protein [Acidobacteriia bacterium]|jgi:protein-tyrosine phosphatase|nr:dual specificity protein phosphatase family protein [Terriglobia bacterium]